MEEIMDQKRVVVKIGSSSLTKTNGEIDFSKLRQHVSAIVHLKQRNYEVILVSSGAVACGFKKMGYSQKPITLKGRQAAAAVGQSLLIQAYTEALESDGYVAAQLLLTRQDFQNKTSYQNAQDTIEELLERNVLPIINENDTVSIKELTFGDNDQLSALVSGLVHAEQLIILTDINGLYDANPNVEPSAKRFDHLDCITDELLSFATSEGSKVGTGGMQSKLLAAKTAFELGVNVFIGTGDSESKLLEILNGDGDGTYIAKENPQQISSQKQWISLFSETNGSIYIDEGAENAILNNGKSLLPAGVYLITGDFIEGDVVDIYRERRLIGKGEVRYNSDELKKCMGKRTDEINNHTVVVHRDRFVSIT
ncbi:glutamate 5-kinase 1 [Kurthia zopfii]|nr:glutamate 5-kinase 1 [Kurthia zopfii]